ncbi:hypothetical protein ACFQXA_35120 [Nocardiopsis composta]
MTGDPLRRKAYEGEDVQTRRGHGAQGRAHARRGDAGDGDQEEKKKINLSAPQVIAGGIATLTAATAASFLGVYGTILGAAVMSVMSTAGTAVTQHFLERSRDKAKEVVGAGLTVVHRGGPSDPSDPDAAAGPGRYRDPEATAVFGSVGTAGAADATRAMPSSATRTGTARGRSGTRSRAPGGSGTGCWSSRRRWCSPA